MREAERHGDKMCESVVAQFQERAEVVSRGRERKYYRFRWAHFYGGIATADCVGCGLTCLFCWSWNIVTHPERYGTFYSPQHVAQKLVRIARYKRGTRMRISGNEPTLNREHLLGVLEAIPASYRFILETNGILLGADRDYCRDLSKFPHLRVRVSIKGCSAHDFEKLTGAGEKGFELQIQALENLADAGVICYPAVMSCFSSDKSFRNLRDRLRKIDPEFYSPETEELILYPPVEKRLKRYGLME